MPELEIEDSETGKKYVVDWEGDTDPTDDEILQIISEGRNYPQKAAADKVGSGILPMYMNAERAAKTQLGGVLGQTGRVIAGQPEALSDFTTTLNTPIPMMKATREYLESMGPAGKVAGAFVPQSAIDIGTLMINPAGTAVRAARIADIASAPVAMTRAAELASKPIQRGVDIVSEAFSKVFGSPAERSQNLMKKASDMMRVAIAPAKNDIVNLEIRGGRSIDSYMKMAADERLPLRLSSDGKTLDTSAAREILSDKLQNIYSQADEILSSPAVKSKFIGWDAIRKKAKSDASAIYKTATEEKAALKDIDEIIDDEIQRYGARMIEPQKMNRVKQGLWEIGYDQNRPTLKQNARLIGRAINEKINDAVGDKSLRMLNEKSGDYLTLVSLLENAHGRPAVGGKIERIFSKILGSIVGNSSGVPVLGPIAGAAAGEAVQRAVSNPARISANAAKLMQRAENITRGAYRTLPAPQGMRTALPSVSSAAQYSVGMILQTPRGDVEVVGFDSDGHPLVEPIQQ